MAYWLVASRLNVHRNDVGKHEWIAAVDVRPVGKLCLQNTANFGVEKFAVFVRGSLR
jgi:hypothetical protein